MTILVGCERSQTITIEFRQLGHNAYSCDLQECTGGHPEWHIITDVIPILNGNCTVFTQSGEEIIVNSRWDMIIAHPPCTYMSNAGACRMYPKAGIIDEERFKKALEAKEFFMKCMNADCDKIMIENPVPLKIIGLPPFDQKIHPYMFGEPYKKGTLLWLKGLPKLIPTNVVSERKPYIQSNTSVNKGKHIGEHFAHGSNERSKTFIGIAKAIATQYSESGEVLNI